MSASLSDLQRWFDEGLARKATIMVVALDTFDYENYPVYFDDVSEARKEVDRLRSASMSSVDEVYLLDRRYRGYQFGLRRAFVYSEEDIPDEHIARQLPLDL